MSLNEPLSLRSRQRALVRDSVLDAAVELFAEMGYQKATMQAIANQAGIGIATLFRHFKTKGSVLADLVRRDLEELFAETQMIVDNPPESPRDGMVAICLCAVTILDKRSKKVRLKPSLWPAMSTGKPETDEVVEYADNGLRQQISDMLIHYKKAGRIRPEIEVADMTSVIFYVYNGHYVDFNFGFIRSRAEFENRLRVRIALLFDDWMI